MGNGSFNLTALWRALGIKNPETSISERVQPIINVGDFTGLVPQHFPPTNVFGGDVTLVIGEFGTVQVISRDPGGCILKLVQSGTAALAFQTQAVPEAGLTPVIPTTQFSNEPVQSIVESGTVAVQPGDPNISPTTIPSNFQFYPGANPQFWIPPGRVFVMFTVGAAAIINWSLFVVGLPAAENLQ